jgi:hypothetical protein
MRCVFGLVLCGALCFGGIHGLSAIAAVRYAANNSGVSRSTAQAVGWKVAQKYHAAVYVAAGVISLAACALPSLLSRNRAFNEQDEWRRMSGAGRG